jgi:hypothetical protein
MDIEKMSVKTLLKTKQILLEGKLSILLDHPVTKGDHCESAWIDFFRSFLPNKYAVDKGFVFDAAGNISDQIDIIIYDAFYSPLIFGTDAGEKFITAESVYAVFDSKPEINKSTLKYTNDKIKSVACLVRSSRDMINSGRTIPARGPIHILGGILAINSVANVTLRKHLADYSLVDVGCAIKATSFLAKRNDDGTIYELKTSSPEESVIAFFYIILDELYKIGTVAAIDIREYADRTMDSIKLNRGEI